MKSITAVLILICAACILLVVSTLSFAGCRYVWSDHDYNSSTPPLRVQVCDRPYDVPAINQPSIRPIQVPQIKPIQPIVIPPIGTNKCKTESIYNTKTKRWENQRVCY